MPSTKKWPLSVHVMDVTCDHCSLPASWITLCSSCPIFLPRKATYTSDYSNAPESDVAFLYPGQRATAVSENISGAELWVQQIDRVVEDLEATRVALRAFVQEDGQTTLEVCWLGSQPKQDFIDAVSCNHCGHTTACITLCSSCHITISRRGGLIESEHSAAAATFVPGRHRPLLENSVRAKKQIDQVITLIQDLGATRLALISYIFAERYKLAPVRKLPHEILALILFELIEPNDITGDGYMPTLVVSQVSRVWRNVASVLPELWSHILVSPLQSDSFCLVEHTLTACLKHFQGHAKDTPLTLHLQDPYEYLQGNSEFHDFLVVVTSQSHRWKMLTIGFNFLQDLPTSMNLAMLTNLIVEQDAEDQYYHGSSFVNLASFSTAPMLRSVEVYVGYVDVSQLPLQQLTTLRGSILLDGFIERARSPLTHLEHLELLTGSCFSSVIPALIIQFPSIQSLKMHNIEYISCALPVFSCPSLRRIHLSSGQIRSSEEFCQMMSNSSHCLDTLCLENISFDMEQRSVLAEMFAAVPSIRVLHLDGINNVISEHKLSDGLTDSIVAQLLDRTLLPRLTKFSVVSEWRSPYGGEAFLRFLRSRTTEFQPSPGKSPLEIIRLKFIQVSAAPMEIRELEKALRADGVDMEVF